MAFRGFNFVYDEIPSEAMFHLVITTEPGEIESPSGGEVELVTDKVRRNDRFQLLGVEQAEPLSFELEFASPERLDRYEIDVIHAWLVGKRQYRRLIIDQPDLQNVYYNCVFTQMSNVYYSGGCYAFRCTAVCDAPWAWEVMRQSVWTCEDSDSTRVSFYNQSRHSGYLYPQIQFTMASGSTDFAIINHSMGGLTSSFEGLEGGETITLDNQNQIITSSRGYYRADKFNKTFFKLVRGKNELEFAGRASEVMFQYQYPRKVGA
ncbi:MAG: phage tail family protein [Clostridiales bacterium]|nr:phage tail family protein [Clostridiales bacterium]